MIKVPSENIRGVGNKILNKVCDGLDHHITPERVHKLIKNADASAFNEADEMIGMQLKGNIHIQIYRPFQIGRPF